ncbi:hypothetical protein SEA_TROGGLEHUMPER_83 [Rhodococcus phage Trogglehumper]|uniref:Uncharacterized protein n=1 Tax=Rhodococcus phage Trogglehumper TaxID=3038381 RepID=A0AAF0GLF6_9CAUD|nr:hypothetical protein SEA_TROGGLEHUMPER_83 [Rhodococcus phage Trogglehumper]
MSRRPTAAQRAKADRLAAPPAKRRSTRPDPMVEALRALSESGLMSKKDQAQHELILRRPIPAGPAAEFARWRKILKDRK